MNTILVSGENLKHERYKINSCVIHEMPNFLGSTYSKLLEHLDWCVIWTYTRSLHVFYKKLVRHIEGIFSFPGVVVLRSGQKKMLFSIIVASKPNVRKEL